MSASSTAFQDLQCLDVWGGNEPVDRKLAVTGLDVSVRSEPWRQQAHGGDLYLVSMCACAAISRFILADVAGHGDRVAPIARRLRKLMYKHINAPDQTQLACAISDEFAAMGPDGRFATALILTFLPETDHLVVCNAGHPPPLLYREATKEWQLVTPDASGETARYGDFPLGVLPGTTYHQCVLRLQQGDMVLLFTDGLIESADSQGRQLGMAGLRQLVQTLSADVATLPDDLWREAGLFHSQSRNDDHTIMLLSHNGKDPPRQSTAEKLNVMARMIGVRLTQLTRA